MTLYSDNLKANLRAYVDMVTERSKGDKWICPLCGSGNGKNHTGAFSVQEDGTHWKCFSCGESGDIFDLIGKHENISDKAEQAKRASEIFGAWTPTEKPAQKKPENEQDYTEFFKEASKHLEETEYHRGISIETLRRFNVGYCPKWKHPKTDKAPETPRLIIPTSNTSYLARDTRANLEEKQKDYRAQKVGKAHLFNGEALKSKEPVFIVEGEIDALSIIDEGGNAIGLGSISNINKLLNALPDNPPPLILALDNDERGKEAEDKLAEELTKRNTSYIIGNLYSQHKDANEALQADRQRLHNAITAHIIKASRAEEEEYRANYSARSYLDEFLKEINEARTPAIPTGFKKLDETLGGGLYAGLYTIGAISTLGKTTYCLQMLDNIAEAGTDVLIFSLEMSRFELMAKSLSRLTYMNNKAQACSMREIKDGKTWQELTKEKGAVLTESLSRYERMSKHIYIFEGVGDIGVKQIRETVEKHAKITGRAPVVLIDYLQILAPAEPRATEKQNTDKAVLELKRISRDFKTPVLCISSFNRYNYNEAVNMSSFKESGAIEYSSDVLLGMQARNAQNAETALQSSTRNLEIKILKNRNGRVGDTIQLLFEAKYNFFAEK